MFEIKNIINNIFNIISNGIHFVINTYHINELKLETLNPSINIIIYRLQKLSIFISTPILLYNFLKSNHKLTYICLLSLYIYNYDNICMIYENRIYYIDKLLNILLTLKIKYFNQLKNIDHDFKLQKVELYINLDLKTDVTNFFYKNKINQINIELINNLFKKEEIIFEENDDIRLKIYFKFLDKEYIIYFPYKRLMNDNDSNEYYIPYPPFDKKIMEDFRHDIVLPYHNITLKKKMLYSLFHIDSKDILTVEINKQNNEQLVNYFNKIKTPFLDYGLLYNVPVKLRWILLENNIDINEFKEFYFKFLNMYLCEEEYDLKEHHLLMGVEDLDNIFITERMKKILKEKEEMKIEKVKKDKLKLENIELEN